MSSPTRGIVIQGDFLQILRWFYSDLVVQDLQMIIHLMHSYVAFAGFVGNFTSRWYVDVAARHTLSVGQPMMAL